MDDGVIEVGTGEAEVAYTRCAADWKTRDVHKLETPRVSLPAVISRVLQVAKALQAPEVTRAFEGLATVPMPAGPFVATCVASIETHALALWHVRTRYLAAESMSSSAKLPAVLVKEATDLRTTMFRVVGYHCVDPMRQDDPVARDLASIRSVDGSVYLDLATDLSRLAVYYRDPQWAAAFAGDVQNYRATDATTADATAAKILATLGERDDEAARWLQELQRGWAALQADYDMARRGAAVVFWPRGAEVVPALAALHAEGRRRGAAASADPTDPTDSTDSPKPEA